MLHLREMRHLRMRSYERSRFQNVFYKILSKIIYRHLSHIVNDFVESNHDRLVRQWTTSLLYSNSFKNAVKLWKIMVMNSFLGKLKSLIRATMEGIQNSVKISVRLNPAGNYYIAMGFQACCSILLYEVLCGEPDPTAKKRISTEPAYLFALRITWAFSAEHKERKNCDQKSFTLTFNARE